MGTVVLGVEWGIGRLFGVGFRVLFLFRLCLLGVDFFGFLVRVFWF